MIRLYQKAIVRRGNALDIVPKLNVCLSPGNVWKDDPRLTKILQSGMPVAGGSKGNSPSCPQEQGLTIIFRCYFALVFEGLASLS